MTTTIETVNLFDRMRELGFSHEETETMIRAERALRRWSEQECGNSNAYCAWSIERDEETGVPYRCVYPNQGNSYRTRIPDREASAKRRIGKIMEKHPELWFFHQGDPRGCAVWVGRNSEVAGMDVATCYTRGVAVCLA